MGRDGIAPERLRDRDRLRDEPEKSAGVVLAAIETRERSEMTINWYHVKLQWKR